MHRTRIKICGLTRECDIEAAVSAGADALGLVFYPPSARFVSLSRAAELSRAIPPFVTTVGLFVDPAPAFVHEILDTVPLQMLQFHGDETPSACAGFGLPWIKAARMRPGLDLVRFETSYSSASGFLLDAYVEGYGGGGETFDWGLIPSQMSKPMILSGGLSPQNVTGAVRRLRPWAVDVSSGVESDKGIKDAALIAAFIQGVRNADR